MLRQPWRRFITLLADCRELILPGTLIIGLVCLVRLSGLLQTQEWTALDAFSRHCLLLARQQRVAIISIDHADYQATGSFPISEQVMIQALTILQQYQPRAVGLDLASVLSSESGPSTLASVLQAMPNVVAVADTPNPEPAQDTDLTMRLSSSQVGFAGLMVDADGKLRRVVLAARDSQGTLRYSLALQLAKQYLQAENVPFRYRQPAANPIRFGQVTIPRFRPNSGGYIRADADGDQVLLNFCMLQKPYQAFPLRDLLAENIAAEQLRDRVVLIGPVATRAENSYITSAVRSTLYSQRVSRHSLPTQLIYGVEVHAHAAQEIISSVLDRPCVLVTWPDWVEYLWIVGWGLLGIVISVRLKSPWKSVLSLAIATLGLMALGYGQLSANKWIPVIPTALALCGAGLVTAFFDRDIRFELAQRRITIERTYEAVHNGPLQRLAAILRGLGEPELASEQLRQQLQTFNAELRNIFEHMRQDTAARRDGLYLADDTVLDLQQPLADLLYQVYDHTLNQDLPGFSQVQTYIPPDFECLNRGRFSLEQKRGLCLFLQEALLNIGKHAIGTTRIDVTCPVGPRHYRLQVIDNGKGFTTRRIHNGQGTQQAKAIAHRLRGQFRRRPNSPQGIISELIWPKPRRLR